MLTPRAGLGKLVGGIDGERRSVNLLSGRIVPVRLTIIQNISRSIISEPVALFLATRIVIGNPAGLFGIALLHFAPTIAMRHVPRWS